MFDDVIKGINSGPAEPREEEKYRICDNCKSILSDGQTCDCVAEASASPEDECAGCAGCEDKNS